MRNKVTFLIFLSIQFCINGFEKINIPRINDQTIFRKLLLAKSKEEKKDIIKKIHLSKADIILLQLIDKGKLKLVKLLFQEFNFGNEVLDKGVKILIYKICYDKNKLQYRKLLLFLEKNIPNFNFSKYLQKYYYKDKRIIDTYVNSLNFEIMNNTIKNLRNFWDNNNKWMDQYKKDIFFNRTPIHWAMIKGRFDLYNDLKRYYEEENYNPKDSNGKTVKHYEAEYKEKIKNLLNESTTLNGSQPLINLTADYVL